MPPSLIELLFRSQLRQKLLFLLKRKPRTGAEIQNLFHENLVSVQLQLKVLMESELIFKVNGVYKLSRIGEVLVWKQQGLLELVRVFESNSKYWAKRDLSAIPLFLRKRIGEIGPCELFEPESAHMFETPRYFVEKLAASKEVLTFVSYFHPEAPSLYAGLVKRGAELKLCMSKEVAVRLFENYPKETQIMREAPNSELLLCSKPVSLPSLVVTDCFMALKLYEVDGRPKDQLLFSSEKRALLWSRELFIYYMEASSPLF